MPASFMPSSDIILGIWNSTTNLDSWINNVVASMTNGVRRTARMSQLVYSGTAYQLGVMVRWMWLILPLAMAILSILLLIGSESSRCMEGESFDISVVRGRW
jgi:hypothetical protein